MMKQRNYTRVSRFAVKTSVVGGALVALVIGCTTSGGDAKDGELAAAREPLSLDDPCLNNPDSYGCDNYGTGASSPSTPGGAVANTTYWRIEQAGWQLSVSAPVPSNPGSDTSASSDTLRAMMTMLRTSSATSASSRAFGAAIVRAIPRPVFGGTIDTACTQNADCYSDRIVKPDPANSDDGVPDGSFNYCVQVGTNTVKTCVQRPGGGSSWQTIVLPNDTFTLGQSKVYNVPDPPAPDGGVKPSGAPYGTTATVLPSDHYSVMATLNVVGKVTYTDADGGTKSGAPCSLYNVLSPNNIPYEEDPAYCFKMVRPMTTFNPWACGDNHCNGTESASTCLYDCPVCGDGRCTHGESACTCPDDCGSSCGSSSGAL